MFGKADAEVLFVKWTRCAFSFQTGCLMEERSHGSVHPLRPEIVHGGITLKTVRERQCHLENNTNA